MGLPLLLRGENLSLTERAATTLSGSQTADPLFPYSRLGDTRPSQLFIFPARLEDDFFFVDVNQYLNGGFENWTLGVPNNHTVAVTGTGAVTEETVAPIFAGASSMELDNGASGTVEVLQSIEVLAGDQIELRYAVQTSDAASPATLEVFNPYTGKWLTTAGAWSSRRQNAVEAVDTVMSSSEATLGFSVEAFSLVRNHVVDLEIRYHMDQAAASELHHWDAVRWIPAIDFTSIHAHNMSASIVPRLSSSDTNISGVPVDRATGFDGSSHLERSTEFTGIVDGALGTVSIWFRMLGGDGTNQVLFSNGTAAGFRVRVRRESDNTILVSMLDSGGVVKAEIGSTGTVTADGNLHHVLSSWDSGGVAGDDLLLILDGVRDDAVSIAAGDIDYTLGEWAIGGATDNAQEANADIAELWFDPTDNIDFKVAANVSLFRTAAGKAALLGANGELVNGTSPILYWGGNYADRLTNLGTGGDFDTEAGTLLESINLEAELTKQDVSFYSKLSTKRLLQFWRFHMRGTNAVNPIEVGQWIIAESIEPAWSPQLQNNQEEKTFAQTRAVVEASGEQWAIKKAKHPRRSARMRFRLKSTQQASFKDELLARTSQGADPIVLVEDQSSTKVIHGRMDPESEFRRRAISNELTELIVEESSNGIGLP